MSEANIKEKSRSGKNCVENGTLLLKNMLMEPHIKSNKNKKS
jgi:hypothetical protein